MNFPIPHYRKIPSSIFLLLSFFLFLILLLLSMLMLARFSEKAPHDCTNTISYNDCITTYFMALAQTQGTEVALTEAATMYKTDPTFRMGCHEAMHAIGRNAAQEFGNIGKAFQHGNFLCWSGYYHGVVEGAVRGSNAQMIEPAALNALCAPSANLPLGSFTRFHCTHALGHAIMYRINYDLPQALTHCTSLVRDFDKHQCALGVFMENYLADGKEHKTSWQPEEDLTFPCRVTDKTYASECFFVQGMFTMRRFNDDVTQSFAFCAALTEDAERTQCGEGVGKVIADNAVFDVNISRTACLNTPSAFHEACFFGAIQEIMGIDANPKADETFCAPLTEEDLAACRSAAARVHALLGL